MKQVWRDQLAGVAVLKIDGSGLPTLPLGESGALRVGDAAIVVGGGPTASPSPAGGRATVRATGAATGGNLAIDAPIASEHAGIPVIDSRGRVVGIATRRGALHGGRRSRRIRRPDRPREGGAAARPGEPAFGIPARAAGQPVGDLPGAASPSLKPTFRTPVGGRRSGGRVEPTRRRRLRPSGETRCPRARARPSTRPPRARERPGRECPDRGGDRGARGPRRCRDGPRRRRRSGDRSPADRASASGRARSPGSDRPNRAAKNCSRLATWASDQGPAPRYSATSGVERSAPGDTAGGSAARRLSACASTRICWESASWRRVPSSRSRASATARSARPASRRATTPWAWRARCRSAEAVARATACSSSATSLRERVLVLARPLLELGQGLGTGRRRRARPLARTARHASAARPSRQELAAPGRSARTASTTAHSASRPRRSARRRRDPRRAGRRPGSSARPPGCPPRSRGGRARRASSAPGSSSRTARTPPRTAPSCRRGRGRPATPPRHEAGFPASRSSRRRSGSSRAWPGPSATYATRRVSLRRLQADLGLGVRGVGGERLSRGIPHRRGASRGGSGARRSTIGLEAEARRDRAA